MRKILYITNGINGSGGLERVLSVKASLLAEKYGYDVSILVLNNAQENPFYLFSPQIKFHSINVGGNPFNYITSYKKGIQNTVNKMNPDIISVCDDGIKAFFIPQFLKTNAKIIYERHVSKLAETGTRQSWKKNLANKTVWKLMDILGNSFYQFIVLTEGNKNEWKTLRNLKVISNPLSFYPEQSSSLQAKKIISVGKISYQKGQDLLIQAWEKISNKYPDWTLELYGKENQKFLDTSNLPKTIVWYPPIENIKEKYLESSIYVMPSRFEGFGMVLIEAMACGVPCVSFDCNYGPSDIIRNNEDGFLVEKDNVEMLVTKITELIENTDKRLEFGKAAKLNIKRYLPDSVVGEWDLLFRNLK